MASPSVTRIESQLMMLRHDAGRVRCRAPDCLSVFERNFMRIDLRRAALAEGPCAPADVRREVVATTTRTRPRS